MFVIPNPRTSEAIEAIKVDPIKGVVVTRFRSNGYEYKYSNVSRLKIVNLLLQPNMSLGFWVYNNLSKVAVRELSYLRGNTVATGQLCYNMVGASYDSKAALPC
tara:strand:+ start:149 stop:460 length:312 start_codon:yes stop_codon:yes gene_type:complete